MGWTSHCSTLIQDLRTNELELSKKFRGLIVWVNMIGTCSPVAFCQKGSFPNYKHLANLSDQLTPVVVIAAAIFWTKASQDTSGLTVAETFTSLSIIALVSSPITNIMGAYPSFKASIGCFDRIQEYLQFGEAVDSWTLSKVSDWEPASSGENTSASHDIELQDQSVGTKKAINTITKSDLEINPAIIVESGSFGDSQGVPIVKGVTLSFRCSKLTVIIGPVGCGKTTFLKALLGEVSLSSGSVQIFGGLEAHTAYCDQQSWLFNSSIKDNITGPQDFDAEYFDTVVRACDLDVDMAQLPKGVDTIVGSEGIVLSGGQKQRIVRICLSLLLLAFIITSTILQALARAVYSRKRLLLLDDILNGVDRTTLLQILHNLFDSVHGLLRKQAQQLS